MSRSLAPISSGQGIVGYGRTLFTPTCAYTCLNALWALELPCSSPPNITYALNSPQCHASTPFYLTSLASCIEQYCPPQGISDQTMGRVWAQIAADGLPVDASTTYTTMRPNDTLAFGATSLSHGVLIGQQTYDQSETTILSFASQESSHELYSLVIFLASIAFALVIGGFVALGDLTRRRLPSSPFLNKYLLMPALFRNRHLRTIPGKFGYMPQRSTSIMIIIFVVINVISNFVNYPSATESVWYRDAGVLYTTNLSNRLAVLAMANMSLAIALSGRSSIIMYLTGCSRTTLIAYHRWAGVVEAVVHSAIYLSTTDKYTSTIYTSAGALHYMGCEDPYWDFGVAGLWSMGAIFVFTRAPIRIWWYEIFLISHVALVVSLLVTLWYHLRFRYHGQYGYEVWLYLAFAFWGLDRVIRLAQLVVLNRGLVTGRTPSPVIELTPGSDFIKVTVYPSTAWQVQPGQYCFLYFPTVSWFWESHPFSIASWTDGTTSNAARDVEVALESEEKVARRPNATAAPCVTFIIRPGAGITRKLRRRVTVETPRLHVPVLIEGPYGRPARDSYMSETIMAYAGWVGITGVLGHLNQYTALASTPGRHPRFRTKRFILRWLVRNEGEMRAVMPLLPSPEVAERTGVDLRIFTVEANSDRVDFASEISGEREGMARGEQLEILTCAPPAMSDEIRRAVAKMQGGGRARLGLSEEAFAW